MYENLCGIREKRNVHKNHVRMYACTQRFHSKNILQLRTLVSCSSTNWFAFNYMFVWCEEDIYLILNWYSIDPLQGKPDMIRLPWQKRMEKYIYHYYYKDYYYITIIRITPIIAIGVLFYMISLVWNKKMYRNQKRSVHAYITAPNVRYACSTSRFRRARLVREQKKKCTEVYMRT